MVDGSGTESEEEIRQAVLEELKPNGLVNDDPEIYGAWTQNFPEAPQSFLWRLKRTVP